MILWFDSTASALSSFRPIDNGDASAQMYWGFFVNPDKNHVISTPRCFGGGLAPDELLPVEQGHVNVRAANAD